MLICGKAGGVHYIFVLSLFDSQPNSSHLKQPGRLQEAVFVRRNEGNTRLREGRKDLLPLMR